MNQAHLAQHAQVLGNRRLVEADRDHDVADLAFAYRKKTQNLAPARFGDGIEGVRCGGGSCHETNNTCLYWNMSREFLRAF